MSRYTQGRIFILLHNAILTYIISEGRVYYKSTLPFDSVHVYYVYLKSA